MDVSQGDVQQIRGIMVRDRVSREPHRWIEVEGDRRERVLRRPVLVAPTGGEPEGRYDAPEERAAVLPELDGPERRDLLSAGSVSASRIAHTGLAALSPTCSNACRSPA